MVLKIPLGGHFQAFDSSLVLWRWSYSASGFLPDFVLLPVHRRVSGVVTVFCAWQHRWLLGTMRLPYSPLPLLYIENILSVGMKKFGCTRPLPKLMEIWTKIWIYFGVKFCEIIASEWSSKSSWELCVGFFVPNKLIIYFHFFQSFLKSILFICLGDRERETHRQTDSQRLLSSAGLLLMCLGGLQLGWA